MTHRFFKGFGFILRGRNIIKSAPHLYKWALAPFAIDVLVFIAFLYFGLNQMRHFAYKYSLHVLGSPAGDYFNFFYYPLLILFWCMAFVFCFYAVYVLATIVASPFNSILAKKTLIHLGYVNEKESTFAEVLRSSVDMFWVSLLRMVVLLLIGLLLILFSLLPGLNLLAAYVVFIILAFDSMDYSFETMNLNIKQRFQFFKQHLIEFCGMGAFVGLTAFIPGLTLLLMPFAVVGSASLYGELLKGRS